MNLSNNQSPVHHSFDAAEFTNSGSSAFKLGQHYAMDDIEAMCRIAGVGFTNRAVQQIMQGHAMDTIQQPLTSGGMIPVQFLQNWLPGQVEIVTAAREIDTIVGVATVGDWADEQVVQEVIEMSGAPSIYGDTSNVPLTEWNPTFEYRTVVRFEQGMRVGLLEETRSARIQVNSGDKKRRSAAIQLEIARNRVGFYGYNSGNNLTYGFLNDPSLPAYVTVANPGSGTTWAVKTFLQIQADLLTAFQALRTQSKGLIKPNKDAITLAVATSAVDYLAKTSDMGVSVWAWLKEFYGNVRVVDAPELNAANGGANVFYVFADSVADSGTDDQKTFIQVVPAKFQLLGLQKLTKAYEEDYSNATAGIMCKRPYAVVRYSGI